MIWNYCSNWNVSKLHILHDFQDLKWSKIVTKWYTSPQFVLLFSKENLFVSPQTSRLMHKWAKLVLLGSWFLKTPKKDLFQFKQTCNICSGKKQKQNIFFIPFRQLQTNPYYHYTGYQDLQKWLRNLYNMTRTIISEIHIFWVSETACIAKSRTLRFKINTHNCGLICDSNRAGLVQ